MPKVASTTSPTKVEHPANSSASRAHPGKENETVQVQDKSQWRPSRIEPGCPIGKTDAIARYHLKANDMQGLTFITGSIPIKVNGKYKPMTMYNYEERTVEMRAWEKYGGPEKFDEMLNKKAAKYCKRHGSIRSFPKPRTYKLAGNL